MRIHIDKLQAFPYYMSTLSVHSLLVVEQRREEPEVREDTW